MEREKIALVTGANQGIGFATAKLLLEKGFKVIVTARDEQKGLEAFKMLSSFKKCFFHPLDITDTQSIQRLQHFIEQKFTTVDILINNAAINYDTWHNVLDASLNEVEQTLNTNLLGAWRLSQVLIPLMQKQGFGRVVNVSSGAGSFASQTGSTPAYSLSKLALNALTMQFANHVGSSGVLVNAVCPGWVRTKMGGMSAPRSAKEAAAGIVWVALQDEHNGKFFRDKTVISW